MAQTHQPQPAMRESTPLSITDCRLGLPHHKNKSAPGSTPACFVTSRPSCAHSLAPYPSTAKKTPIAKTMLCRFMALLSAFRPLSVNLTEPETGDISYAR